MKFLRPFQPKNSATPQVYSLIDVGRETVKAAILQVLPDSGEFQVVGYGQAETGGHDITGGRIKAGVVTRPVNTALTQAEDSTERFIGRKIVPDDAIFALAGRATIGKLFGAKQLRPNPKEPISAREMENLQLRAERLVAPGLNSALAESGQWQPLAVTDAGIRLDGRLVTEAVGLTGREISLAIFGVAVQASALRALEVLANRLDLLMANVVAAPQALAWLAPQPESVLLDVGFSGTDICLIRDNALAGADWIPFGGYFFEQTLATALELEPAAAKKRLHAWSGGHLSRAEAAETRRHLAAAYRRWYEGILEVLDELSYTDPWPRHIYLTGGAGQLPGLGRLFRTNPEPFDSAPEVSLLAAQPPPLLKDMTDGLDYNLFGLALSLTIGLPE